MTSRPTPTSRRIAPGVVSDLQDMGRDPRRAAETAARRSYGKLVAYLAARTRDVAAAEDALADAFAQALADWPKRGAPDNPEAWLMTVARRKLIDAARRRQSRDAASGRLQLMAEELAAAPVAADIPDQRLALLFACAHPAIDASVHAALMLQTVLGLNAATIAGAFLVSPDAMGRRLGRAKAKIRKAGVPFRIPDRAALPQRMGAVLDAIYAAFAEGWTDPGGTDAARRELTAEALFLVRTLVELAPAEPEALGLLALMLHADARRPARRDEDGGYIPLADQDPERWNAPMIAEAEALLRRAAAMGAIGRYQLEAAVQSAHVHRRRTGVDNWAEVVGLYDALFSLTDSPVVAINRALAVAELRGAAAALEALPDADADPRLAGYQPYWAARADLLARTGARDDARRAYEIAIGLERDPAVRRFLQQRRLSLGG
jgi:predicted RNA polymerase sigma factor